MSPMLDPNDSPRITQKKKELMALNRSNESAQYAIQSANDDKNLVDAQVYSSLQNTFKVSTMVQPKFYHSSA